MDLGSASDISQAIQLAVAPVFLLAGIGAFINAFAARLGRIFDRSRHLEAEVRSAGDERRGAIEHDLATLQRRARLAYIGIALGTLSALLVCVLIALAFSGQFFGFGTGDLIAALFMAAMLSLIGGLIAFLQEISIAVRWLSIGKQRIASTGSDF
jgi:Protein of unknown function (DUF2721)